MKDKQKSRYERLKSQGKCIRCLEPAEDGYTRCQACKIKAANKEKRDRIRREKHALCIDCGKPGMDVYLTCEDCRQKSREDQAKRYRARKEALASMLKIIA